MPNNCIVPLCKSASDKKGTKLHTFRFPRDDYLHHKWICAINRENFLPTKYSRVCQHHFEDHEIERITTFFVKETGITLSVRLERPRLKKGAIPSKLLGNSTENKRSKKEVLDKRQSASNNSDKFDIKMESSSVKENADKMEVDEKKEDNVEKVVKMEVESEISNESCKENSPLPSKNHNGPSNGIVKNIKVEPEDKNIDADSNIKQSTDDRGSDEPDSKGIIQLSIEGANEDSSEEATIMTSEEVREYLLQKIGEFMNNSVNPMYDLHSRATELENLLKAKVTDFSKFNKLFDLLHRNHEKFLRYAGVLPKVHMSSASVSVDLPVLEHSVPQIAKPELILKKELSITKVENPTVNNTAQSPSQSSAKSASKIECIDLTDESEPIHSATSSTVSRRSASFPAMTMLKHPAPLPPRPFSSNTKNIPPKPRLKISAEEKGIVLQWDMPPIQQAGHVLYDPIGSFEIFGYQEQKNIVINTLLWKKIGTVKAMSLPMACTLTQFVEGNKYHFSIRAVDCNNRCGAYSDAISIVYNQKSSLKK